MQRFQDFLGVEREVGAMTYPVGAAIEDGGKLLLAMSMRFPKALQGPCFLDGTEVRTDKVFGEAFLHVVANRVGDDEGGNGGPAEQAARLEAAEARAESVALVVGGYTDGVDEADVRYAVGELSKLVWVVGEAVVVVVVGVK